MTKALATLIKLHKKNVDAMRKELVIQLDAKDQALGHIRSIDQQVENEKQLLASDAGDDVRFAFSNFYDKSQESKAKLYQTIRELDQNIKVFEERIAEEFAEMKKFELLKEAKEKEVQEELDRKEVQEMDELSLNTHRRKEGVE